jgi:Arc/MetJ-type ribon-helix-helix transcriptional regulator
MEDLEEWLRKGGFAPKSEVLAELLREIMKSMAKLHRRTDR